MCQVRLGHSVYTLLTSVPLQLLITTMSSKHINKIFDNFNLSFKNIKLTVLTALGVIDILSFVKAFSASDS